MKLRVVRRLFFGLISFTSFTTGALCLVLAEHLTPKWALQVLSILPLMVALLMLLMVMRGRVAQTWPQTVATEAVWVASCIPFHAIFILLEIGSESDNIGFNIHSLVAALRAFQWITGSLLAIYFMLLVVLAVATWYTVDPHVWSRDPAASPGPFPLGLILVTLSTRTREATLPDTHDVCMPGCTCKEKLPPWSPTPLPGSMSPGNLLMATQDAQHSVACNIPVHVPTPAQRTRTYSVHLGPSNIERLRSEYSLHVASST